ncbi:MAG: DUF2383 domain-containing protein [Ruminiclostridium sp.]|nr:DUF2383 domain-containing protein [Ruminiclostridium sp.]
MLVNNDIDVLNTIYKNSRMAYDSTSQVIERCADTDLRQYLRRQQAHYAKNCREVREALREDGLRPHKVPTMPSVMAGVGIAMKTMRDHSRETIAELMYNGTNMGIVDIARSVNRAHNASDKTVRMAETLLGEEEEFADGLRKFL